MAVALLLRGDGRAARIAVRPARAGHARGVLPFGLGHVPRGRGGGGHCCLGSAALGGRGAAAVSRRARRPARRDRPQRAAGNAPRRRSGEAGHGPRGPRLRGPRAGPCLGHARRGAAGRARTSIVSKHAHGPGRPAPARSQSGDGGLARGRAPGLPRRLETPQERRPRPGRDVAVAGLRRRGGNGRGQRCRGIPGRRRRGRGPPRHDRGQLRYREPGGRHRRHRGPAGNTGATPRRVAHQGIHLLRAMPQTISIAETNYPSDTTVPLIISDAANLKRCDVPAAGREAARGDHTREEEPRHAEHAVVQETRGSRQVALHRGHERLGGVLGGPEAAGGGHRGCATG